VPTPPDLTPILRRIEKLERQRKVMFAVSALAVAIAGISLWRAVAKEAPASGPGKTIEAERIVLLGPGGGKGPSMAWDVDGRGGLAFYTYAGEKLATLEETEFHLMGPGGKERISFGAGKDTTELILFSPVEGQGETRLSMWKDRTEFSIPGPNGETSATIDISKEDAQLSLSGRSQGLLLGQAKATLGVSKENAELNLNGPAKWVAGNHIQTTATLGAVKDGPELFLAGPKQGSARLFADQKGSSLDLCDSQQKGPRVIISAEEKLSGLAVYGPGKMMVWASILKGDGEHSPSLSIVGADGRPLFQKP
jgi:hypothetical protein